MNAIKDSLLAFSGYFLNCQNVCFQLTLLQSCLPPGIFVKGYEDRMVRSYLKISTGMLLIKSMDRSSVCSRLGQTDAIYVPSQF